MARSPARSWPLPIVSLALLLAGCGYHLVNPGAGERIFVEPLRNETRQPSLETAVEDALRRRVLATPGYLPAAAADKADVVVSAVLREFGRDVLFFSPRDPSDVSAARWTLAADVAVRRGGRVVHTGRVLETATGNLGAGYAEEDLVARIADRFSRKVIFLLRTNNGAPGP